MVDNGRADVVDFDPEAVLSAANGAIGAENVFTCVVYDAERFRTVHVDDRLEALYADHEERQAHFGEVHSYVHLDFTERELFEELFRDPEGVRAFVTYMSSLVAVRVVSEKQGVFFSIAPDAPVTKLVTSVEAEMQA
ncbi:hypothetical protein [Natronomonas amylolytica]|uniref:hypothetical protein n=1 Tax=Natronomonas amylolytica TaxID=3108498 RepID=UPI0030096078